MSNGVTPLQNALNTISSSPVSTPSTGDTSSSFPSMLDTELAKIQQQQTAQTSTQMAATSTLKPSLSVINFLKAKFFYKAVPIVKEDHTTMSRVGQLRNIERSTEGSFWVANMLDSNGYQFQSKILFSKNPLGMNYKGYSAPEPITKQYALDSEQRLNSSIGPLMDHVGTEGSSANLPTSPTLESKEVDGGEEADYYDPSDGQVKSGNVVIIKGKPYLKQEGTPLLILFEELN